MNFTTFSHRCPVHLSTAVVEKLAGLRFALDEGTNVKGFPTAESIGIVHRDDLSRVAENGAIVGRVRTSNLQQRFHVLGVTFPRGRGIFAGLPPLQQNRGRNLRGKVFVEVLGLEANGASQRELVDERFPASLRIFIAVIGAILVAGALIAHIARGGLAPH